MITYLLFSLLLSLSNVLDSIELFLHLCSLGNCPFLPLFVLRKLFLVRKVNFLHSQETLPIFSLKKWYILVKTDQFFSKEHEGAKSNDFLDFYINTPKIVPQKYFFLLGKKIACILTLLWVVKRGSVMHNMYNDVSLCHLCDRMLSDAKDVVRSNVLKAL